jgi:hypothetical protein
MVAQAAKQRGRRRSFAVKVAQKVPFASVVMWKTPLMAVAVMVPGAPVQGLTAWSLKSTSLLKCCVKLTAPAPAAPGLAAATSATATARNTRECSCSHSHCSPLLKGPVRRGVTSADSYSPPATTQEQFSMLKRVPRRDVGEVAVSGSA